MSIVALSDLSANGGRISDTSSNLTYTPPASHPAEDLFAYIVADGRGGECVGVVTLHFLATKKLHIDISQVQSSGAKLTMAGVPGDAYQVQASTDFVHWVNIGDVVIATPEGLIEVLDVDAKNYPSRFYRTLAR